MERMNGKFRATAHHDGNSDEWVVRLHHTDGSFCGLCAANGIYEAEMIVECINSVACTVEDRDFFPNEAWKKIRDLVDRPSGVPHYEEDPHA